MRIIISLILFMAINSNLAAQNDQWVWMKGDKTTANSNYGVYGAQGVFSATNHPGTRSDAATWIDASGNFWLFGGYGYSESGGPGLLSDLWKYNPVTNQWAWMKGDKINYANGVYGTVTVAAAANNPGARQSGFQWIDASGNLWLFGGNGYAESGSGYLNDLWKYTPATNQWTWMKGDKTTSVKGIYGTVTVAAAANKPGARNNATGWADGSGNLWLMGGYGYEEVSIFQGHLNDLWKYTIATNQWTWMKGDKTNNSNGVYGTVTVAAAANKPGGRYSATGVKDANNNFWLFGGWGRGETGTGTAQLNDLWRYNPATNQWTWMKGDKTLNVNGVYGSINVTASTNKPGARQSAASAIDAAANIWLFGGDGLPESGSNGPLNDVWKYSIASGNWTWVKGDNFRFSVGSYGTRNVTLAANNPSGRSGVAAWMDNANTIWIFGGRNNDNNEVWKYNTTTNLWTWVRDIPYLGSLGVYGTINIGAAANTPGSRQDAMSWTENGNMLWLFGGKGNGGFTPGGYLSDLWKYDPATSQWIWKGGDTTATSIANYGVAGTAAPTNKPSSRYAGVTWTDNNGKLWMFGGYGVANDLTEGYLNDLWKYDPAIAQWTWMKGSNVVNSQGVYGTMGTASSANNPGARNGAVSWKDASGNLWLFGGDGYSETGFGQLNDLWKYDISTNQWTWMKGDKTADGIAVLDNFNPSLNKPGNRHFAAGWTDASNAFWLFGGYELDPLGSGYNTQLWKFVPATNNWSLIQNGFNDDPASHGIINIPSSDNRPGGRWAASTWTGANGELFLFGGQNNSGNWNDLWKYSISTGLWTWVKGSSSAGSSGSYGVQGVGAASNTPGWRFSGSGWKTSDDQLWFFGGYGYNQGFNGYYQNDLWKIKPCSGNLSISPASVEFCTAGETATLTASGGGATYKWYKDGILMSGSTTASITVAAGGTYYATSTVGSCELYSLSVVVTPPNVVPTLGGKGVYCEGDNVNIGIPDTENDQYYNWRLGGTTGPVQYQVPIGGGGGNQSLQFPMDASRAGVYVVESSRATCPTPVYSNTVNTYYGGVDNLATTDVCPTSVTFNWTQYSNPYAQFQYNVTTSATPPASGASIVSTTATVSSLLPNTTYYIHVRGSRVPFLDVTQREFCNWKTISFVTPAAIVPGAISPATATICAGASQTFTVSGGNTYQWSRNGVPISGASANTYNATLAGTYTVQIFKTGCSAGVSATNNAVLNVTPLPTGTISPATATICTGQTQTLTANGGTSYQWSLNGNPISGATAATYSASAAGTYTVVITNNGCSGPASNNAVITVTPPPTGTISPANASICPGGSQVLTVNGGTTYQWLLNGNPISGATNNTYTATATGTYTVFIFSGGCTGSASNSVIITAASAPTGNIVPASANICTGGSQLLTANGGTSYQWSLNGNPISGATSATYLATLGGTYSVQITNGTCSGPASNTSTITIVSPPSGSISPATANICTGQSQTFTATGGTSYQWSLNGNPISGATSATYSATLAGTYSVVISNNGCTAAASNTASLTVNTLPTGTISPASASICPGGSQLLTANGGTSYQWSLNGNPISGATSATYLATATGTYSVVITSGGCSGPASNTAVISSSSAPTGNIVPASANICTGGSQLLTANGGTSYQWSLNGNPISGATSATYLATLGGTYSVQITNGTCTGPALNTSAITIVSPPSGSISPATASICTGQSQTFTATGGTSYQWSLNGNPISGATSATYSATLAGTYSVVISNNGCTAAASNTASLTVNPLPTGTISPASASICPGGSQLLTANGGTSYQWSLNGNPISGATSATYLATATGTYSVVITSGGCSGPASNSAVISASSAPTGNIVPASANICTGGSQLLTANGGTSYQWSLNGNPISGATSATYLATLGGTYSVQITNGTCSGPASNTSTITIVSPPSGSISPATASICTGQSQTFTATGGTSYQWSLNGNPISGATSATYSATLAGTYSVVISNNGCTAAASNTALLTVNPLPTGNISPASASICPGGSQLLTANGGTSYQWSLNGNPISGATIATYLATATGTYSVVITSGGCSGPASNTAVISSSSAPSGNIVPASANICAGGSQLLTANGGTSYQWSLNGNPISGATSATYLATLGGTYSVQITNGTCSGPASNTSAITIVSPPSGSISPATASICTGQSQTFTATGGTSYQWSLNGNPISGATSATYSATLAGTYSVVISNNGCTAAASNTASLTVNPLPTGNISPASASICPGGSQLLTANGGTSYQWSLNGNPISGATSATYLATATGTYSVVITNGGCSGPASNTAVISSSSAPSGNIVPASANICAGGSQLLTANGGTSYQWSLNGNPISGATSATYNATLAGTYSVVITNGTCSGPASNTSSISVTSLPTGSISPANASICAGQSQLLTANGGTSYQWALNGNPITGATSATYPATIGGTYSVTIFNGGCSGPANNTALVTVNPLPTGTISPAIAAICQGQTQVLTANGGSSYEWYRDGNLIAGATSSTYTASLAGTYMVIIINNGCRNAASNAAVLTVNTLPVGAITPASASFCSGQSQLLTTSGGSTYQWYLNGNPIAGATSSTYTATLGGTYSVILGTGLCTAPASNTSVITVTATPSGTITPATAAICQGQSQLLTATAGASSYQWFLNGNPISGATSSTYSATAAGTYSVTMFNGTCSANATNTASVTVTPLPTGSISPASATFCAGQSQLLTANGGSSYQWYLNGNPITGATGSTLTVTAGGTYSVVLFSNGCSNNASNTVFVTVNPLPSGSVSPASATICAGSSQLLTTSGGATYQWFKDGVAISGATGNTYSSTAAGVYSVDIISAAGCRATASNTSVISLLTKPIPNFTTNLLCQEEVTTFTNTSNTTGSGTITWKWYFGDNATSTALSPTHTYQQAGNFSVKLVASSAVCPSLSDSITKIININPVIPGSLYPIQRIVKNVPAQLTARNIGTQYQWIPAGGLNNPAIRTPIVTLSADGSYLVRITTAAGCHVTDTVNLQVFEGSSVFVPKAFTPNGNNANDLLRPSLVNIVSIDYFRVFNRWGQLMYETRVEGEGWNGRYKNADQPMETYSWIFLGKDTQGNVIKASGKSLLIR